MTSAPLLLPRLMGEAAAAAYLGVSPTTLRKLGIPRRVQGARRLYDRGDLEAYADGLPYEDEGADQAEATCDRAFG